MSDFNIDYDKELKDFIERQKELDKSLHRINLIGASIVILLALLLTWLVNHF
jgi:hypothetical protein